MYDIAIIGDKLSTPYKGMLGEVSEYFPIISRATRNFNKTQSQFMNNMMTLSQPTELRSLRQILAEVTKSKHALDEAFFGIRKKQVEIKRKRRDILNTKDPLDIEFLEIEIAEIENQISSTMGYVEGAIRKIHAYINQYKRLLESLGIEHVTEEAFEKDEERYHIMKVFEQALCAARSRSGVIDEGNHIYFYQIGISGTAAQFEISQFLTAEGKKIQNNQKLRHSDTTDWLVRMAAKYSGCATEFAKVKHIAVMDEKALHPAYGQRD